MRTKKEELWKRILEYRFDNIVPPNMFDHIAETFGGTDAATRAFAKKLAEKRGWSTEFALRAIEEYKRFVFLGISGAIVVTPSKVIDQVWHQHLQFTRAYRNFCLEVLGTEFDHYPELVPTEEQTDVYQAQYAATLDLYQREFNRKSPTDIWGAPKFNRASAPTVAPRVKQRDAEIGWPYDETPLHTYLANDSVCVASVGDVHSVSDGCDGGGGGCSSGCGGSGCGD